MSKKEQKPGNQGELSEQQLDKIAGGQEVKKMGTIVVEAKRENPQVVKMGTITVTAKRETKDASTQVAAAEQGTKKN